MNDKWVTARMILSKFKITAQTLYNWRCSGKIKFRKIGHKSYLYDLESLIGESKKQVLTKNVIYARVSNISQKEDLNRQVELLKNYCMSNGYEISNIYKEIASGMNENRKQLNLMIDQILNRKVSNIFITYKDRLTRFGFNYLKNIFEKNGVKIITLNQAEEINSEKELVEDLISIIHHFSMKVYSNRRKQLNKIKKELSNADN